MLKRLRDSEEGFTLIELLVVVIIIGILAAIAIPTFLNQRERGWQAEVTSAVRNAALDVEAIATNDGGFYPDAVNADELNLAQFGTDVAGWTYDPVTNAAGNNVGFVICAEHGLIGDGTTNNVTYATNDPANFPQNGVQPFDDAAGCTGTAIPAAAPA